MQRTFPRKHRGRASRVSPAPAGAWVRDMDLLMSLLVQKPLNIAAIALLFFLAYFGVRRFRPGGRNRRILMAAAIGWALFALWEALVLWRTPEADIRVDLLLILPALAIVSLWGLLQFVLAMRRR